MIDNDDERRPDDAGKSDLLTTDEVLTTAQAAERLGIARRNVQRLISLGRLPAVRMGREWLIRPAALASVRNRRPGRPSKSSKSPRS